MRLPTEFVRANFRMKVYAENKNAYSCEKWNFHRKQFLKTIRVQMIHLNPIFNSDAAPRIPLKDFSVKSFRKMSELLNAFIFTTNENQNRILDLGKGRLAAGLNLTEISHKRLILINIQILKTPDE